MKPIHKILLAATGLFFISKVASGKTSSARTLSNAGESFIKKWEGLPGGKPALEAYQDTGGVWTIGWGHTENVQPGTRITLPEAISYFKADSEPRIRLLTKWLDDNKIVLNSAQYDALLSFIFNFDFYRFRDSSLAAYLKAGNKKAAADEFLKWVYGKNASGSKVIIPGLVNRRNAERKLFLS